MKLWSWLQSTDKKQATATVVIWSPGFVSQCCTFFKLKSSMDSSCEKESTDDWNKDKKMEATTTAEEISLMDDGFESATYLQSNVVQLHGVIRSQDQRQQQQQQYNPTGVTICKIHTENDHGTRNLREALVNRVILGCRVKCCYGTSTFHNSRSMHNHSRCVLLLNHKQLNKFTVWAHRSFL